MIVIVDYGAGNVRSIANMLGKVGAECRISGDPEQIAQASKLVLPGVGAFDTGMRELEARGLRAALERRVVDEGAPILGVCLGMQLLTCGSEEGELPGLGWIPAKTVRFRFPASDASLKVPHMGWSPVAVRQDSRLFDSMHADPRFYFVHSFHVEVEDEADVLTTSEYGIPFVSGVEKGNVAGVQFHPEKSHKFGLRLYENFARSFGAPQSPAASEQCAR